MLDEIQALIPRHQLMNWLFALLTTSVVYLLLEISKSVVVAKFARIFRHFRPEWEHLLKSVLGATRFWFLLILSLYLGSQVLALSSVWNKFFEKITILACLLQFFFWASECVSFWQREYVERRLEHDAGRATTMKALGFLIRGVLAVVVVLLALDNLGVNITALVAGLGVGGVAVALAVQNILGDLFASLTIVLDKPFVIGDFVVIGEYMGNIEHIGLKTTRIRSLSGEQLVFGNSDLLKSRIRNYKRMERRRVLFLFGVVYQTPYEKLEAIGDIVGDIIREQPGVSYDRIHFKAYGACSLDFEAVYWVEDADYVKYMDVQQSINLKVFKAFQENQIDFAYPTQTLFVEKSTSSQRAPGPVV